MHLTVGSLDEAQPVDAGIHAQGADKTDVRTFRRLDRAQAAVVRIVHVTDLEAGTVTGKTAGAESGETTLVRNFRQRVGLVHELGQLAGAEEGVDHGRERLRVDEVDGVELFAVADIHAFADGAGHTAQAHRELVGQLLAHGADATVAQVVDIVYRGPAVDELDQVLDNFHDIGVGEHTYTRIGVQVQFLVQTIAAHAAKVVALLGEEELVDDVTGGRLIRRFGIAELLVDIVHSLDFRVGRILLQGIVDDAVFRRDGLVLLEEDGLHFGVCNLGDGILVQDFAALYDGEGTLDGDHLTGVLVLEILEPGLEHVGGQLAALVLLEGGLVGGDFIGQTETVQDVLIRAIADSTQKGGDRQLLLTVDVGVHHVVDVRGELDPGALERDNAGAVELGAVGVHALVEEYARGAVKLRNDNSLGAVDDERTGGSHVGNVAEVYVLHAGVKVLVLRVRA